MSEIKRVNLTTVEPSQKDKKVDTKKRTYRFELSLGESNAKICPEYSFADLAKNLRHSNGGDLFDEPDDLNVAAIAQKFEAKYGPKAMQSGKKQRTQEMDDFYDMGDGYDEDDPFIDNTEFYDEVVPYSLTTKHGGFYINQGKLDFKSLNDDSIDEFSSPQPIKKKKKRVLDSDSGGEDAVEETGEALSKKFKAMKRKKLLESKEGEKKKKKLLTGPDGEIVIKKKKKKNLEKLKLKKVSGNSSPQKVVECQVECQTPVPATPAVPVVATPMTPVLNTPATNGSAEVINLDNDPTLKDFKLSIEETFNAIFQGVKEDSSSKSGGEEVKGEQQPTDKNTQLPSQLPPDLAEAIENIKKAARESKEGKSKFFSTYVNKLLLDIELGSKNLQWGSRTSIYNHLGEHLPCGKHALLRRAKKLRESQQEVPLKIPLQRLREAIMREMPALEEQHEQDVAKAKLEAELKDETPETVKEEGSTESDEEEKSDNKKKPRGPRRKFQWTEEIRDLLLDIVATKMKSYNLCKSRNQTAEDFIRAYLDTDIKPIWPQGWMQTRMLFKESRAAHEDMTKVLNKEPKQKKNVSLVKASSPTPEQSNQDAVRTHVSKTEDVIEITDEKTDTVVVNLPNVDVKPLSTVSTYNSSPKISQSSNADSSTGSRINKQANMPWTTPTSTSMSQKPSDTLNNSSSKWSQKADSTVPSVTPTSPSVQKIPVISRSSHQGLSPVSSSTPGGADSSPTSANSNRSFMTAFESFAGAYSRSDTTASISSPQTPKQSILGQQPPKAVSQQVMTFDPQLASPQLQQKSSQEHKVVNAQQPKAAARSSSSMVVNKDIPNASWSNVNSVVPQGKSSSSAGLIGRVPAISPNTVSGSSDKSKQLLVHQEKQTKFINTVCAKLDQSSGSNKKRPQVSNMGSSYQTSPQLKQSAMSYPYSMSSKQDMQQRNTAPNSNGPSPAHKWPSSTSQQIQSCTVIGTSSSMHGPNMPFMRALGPGTPNVQPNAKSKQTYGTIRQPSPPQKAQSMLPRPSPHNETGLLNSPMVSVSRGSTPSPQRSPISPEQPSLSLYEQIQSQIRNQEAMEGQALKNLAMALSFSNSSNPGFQGKKNMDATKQLGK